MNRQIVDGVHWVGFVDWTIRDFHGYVTERGSTYNSYVVVDKEGSEIALIISLAYIIQVQAAAWYVRLTPRIFGAPEEGQTPS